MISLVLRSIIFLLGVSLGALLTGQLYFLYLLLTKVYSHVPA